MRSHDKDHIKEFVVVLLVITASFMIIINSGKITGMAGSYPTEAELDTALKNTGSDGSGQTSSHKMSEEEVDRAFGNPSSAAPDINDNFKSGGSHEYKDHEYTPLSASRTTASNGVSAYDVKYSTAGQLTGTGRDDETIDYEVVHTLGNDRSYITITKDGKEKTLVYKDGEFYADKDDEKKLNSRKLEKDYGLSKNNIKFLKSLGKGAEKVEADFTEDVEKLSGGYLPKSVLEARLDTSKKLKSIMDTRLKRYLNSEFDKWLGKYTFGVPALVCGDKLYEKETDDGGDGGGPIFGNFLNPEARPRYESELERKLKDIRTTIIEGEKSQLTDTLYRYAVTVKLIADKEQKWKVYLKNSCSGATSLSDYESSDGTLGWMDYGSLGEGGYFGMHYAGGTGNDMVFDCSEGENCRFDQACVRWEGEDEYCVTLAHGTGFITEGDC